MKNFFKRFLTCSIAALLISAAALAGACTVPDNGGNNNPNNNGHTDPTKSGYSITLLYPDDTPVKGSDAPGKKTVAIQLLDSNENAINGAYALVGDYGNAFINYKQSGEFIIAVINPPTGYEYKDKITTEAGRGDYTVKLSSAKVSYTINVKLPDGNPAAGVTVTIKQNGAKVEEAVTNASGTAVIEDVYSGNYDVEFTNLPEENISYLPTKLTATTTTLNVELIKLNELLLDDKMSDDELDKWDKLVNFYDNGDGTEVIRFDKTADCYGFTTDEIPEGKKLYYYFTADEDGEYHFISIGDYSSDGEGGYTVTRGYYVVEFLGTSLSGDEDMYTTTSDHFSSNTCDMVPLTLKAGERYYFSYSIPARAPSDPSDVHELSGTREFMIAKPVAGVNRYDISAPGTYDDIKFDTDSVILAFETRESLTPENPLPTDGGIFEIRSNTDLYDVKIEYYAYFNGKDKTPDEVEDDISATDKNFLYTLEVPPSNAGSTHYFKIVIKSKLDGGDIVYPVNIPIIIERVGNAEDNVSPVEYQHATATDKYPEKDAGKEFHYLFNGSTPITEVNVEERGGVWYVTVDGNEYPLVAAISKALPGFPYSYATVEYMGENGTGDDDTPSAPSDTRQNSSLSLYENSSKGEDKTNTKFNYTPFISEYEVLCNSDGVYGVNDELKLFLERYYEQHWRDFAYVLRFEEKDDCCWLLSCGYYA